MFLVSRVWRCRVAIGFSSMRFLPELPLYVICWTTISITSVVSLFICSKSIRSNVWIKEHLESGWPKLGTFRDTLDLEWQDFKRALFYDLRWWFCGHLIGSLVLKILRINPRKSHIKKLFIIIYGMIYASHVLGLLCALLILAEVSSIFIVVKISKTTVPMWLTTFSWIALVQCFLNSQYSLADDYHKSLQFSSMAYTILRSIYFGNHMLIYKRDGKLVGSVDHNKSTNFVECLAYVFYMPLLTFGQLTNFEIFQKQISDKRCLQINTIFLFKRGTKIIFWILFYEVLMHFCHPFALLYEESLMWNISLWALGGTAYLITQLFTVKYVILWSYTSLVAGVDGIDTPMLPECTSHCHKSSIIWRTFDNGLYEFIKRNVYIVMGGSQNGVRKQLAACFCSFLFLCFWHGLNARIALWCLISYASVASEVLVLHGFSRFQAKLSIHLSDNAILRIKYIFMTLNLTLFLGGTLLFLGNINLFKAICYRLFVEGFPVSLLIYLSCIYSGLQAGRAWKEFKTSGNMTNG